MSDRAWPVLRLMSYYVVFFSSRRRHTRFDCDWSSDVCSSDLKRPVPTAASTTPCPGLHTGWDRSFILDPGRWRSKQTRRPQHPATLSRSRPSYQGRCPCPSSPQPIDTGSRKERVSSVTHLSGAV